METIFENLLDLARLPYFAVDGGRLVLTDRSVGPIIDVHAHLALSYLRSGTVELSRHNGSAEHYLPAASRLDLDIYVNKNFTPERIKAMSRDLTMNSFRSKGIRRSHTVPTLTGEMGELGIEQTVILPIDLPVLSKNTEAFVEAARAESRLVSFGSVHPYTRDLEGALENQLNLGVKGMKMHPAVQCVRPDNGRAMKLYRLCGERGLPVLWHCGPVGIEPRLGRYLCQVRWYERPIDENPGTTFVLGHSGALQMEEALALSKRYPNVYLDLSCQSVSNVRTLVDHADPDRILFGSDWPFYHQAIPLAKVLMATEGRPDLRRKILYGNGARMLGL